MKTKYALLADAYEDEKFSGMKASKKIASLSERVATLEVLLVLQRAEADSNDEIGEN
jgi:hypothetical protein